MPDCEKYGELISAYADGMLDEAACRELEAHLASCPHCREELSALRALIAETSALDEDVPEGFERYVLSEISKERSRRKSLRLTLIRPLAAAACFMLIAVAALAVFGGGAKSGAPDLAYDMAASEAAPESVEDAEADAGSGYKSEPSLRAYTARDKTGFPLDIELRGSYRVVYIADAAADGALDDYTGVPRGDYTLYSLPAETAERLYLEGSLEGAEFFNTVYDFIDPESESAVILIKDAK